MSPSKIEWTNETWNPTTGCTKVSPGCAHCYAETLTARYAGAPGWPEVFKPWTPANAAENVVLHPDRLEKPFSWRTPRRVFVNSMSDLFHESIPDEYIDRVFAVMALTPQHTYQVLTKRPERMRAYLRSGVRHTPIIAEMNALKDVHAAALRWPLPNVWLGVTVENQRWADERIPILLDTPAAVRFLSCEPMLGPIDVRHLDLGDKVTAGYGPRRVTWDGLSGWETQSTPGRPWRDLVVGEIQRGIEGISQQSMQHRWIDWVICGGESGPKHREFSPLWAFDLLKQCQEAGVAFFMKQMGGVRPGNKLEDLHPDLRVREFPL